MAGNERGVAAPSVATLVAGFDKRLQTLERLGGRGGQPLMEQLANFGGSPALDGQVPVYDSTLKRWAPGSTSECLMVAMFEDQAAIASNDRTLVQFTGVEWDCGSMLLLADPGGSSGVGVVSVGSGGGGIYHVTASVEVAAPPDLAAGDWLQLAVFAFGSGARGGRVAPISTSLSVTVNVSADIQVREGDGIYAELTQVNAAGTARTITADDPTTTFMAVHRVGPCERTKVS